MSCLIMATLVWSAAVSAQPPPLLDWSFDQPTDLQGWAPNGMMAEVKVADGLLTAKTTDWDPFLFSPAFDIKPTPWQEIHVRMRSSAGGMGEFFWANGEKTEYEGFAPGKETSFTIIGDGEFREYRIRPFWHAEPRIVRLRFDLQRDPGTFAVDWVRIVDRGEPPRAAEPVWDFGKGDPGASWLGGDVADMAWRGGALTGKTVSADTALLGPALDVPLQGRLWVSLRLKASGGQYGVVRWATHEQSGLHSQRFRLRADGRFHTYNVDMADQSAWKGRLLTIGLQPTDQPGAAFELADLRVGQDAAGAPDLSVTYAGPMEAIARVGKPFTVGCILVNQGGMAAENVRVGIGTPGAQRLLPEEPADRYVRVDFAVPQVVEWQLVADQPGEFRPSFTIDPGRDAFAVDGRPVNVTPSLDLPKADYVPEPKPVKTDYLVGTYYFPGWASMKSWQCIQDIAPERKPVLGWYDEANPEVVDWQIKWAAEHGISFFMVDWYWSGGGRSLDHWLHEGYLKARWRKYLQFALMWANHNAPNTHSLEDWRNVTQYWIDHYFGLPEYLRIDDKPAVFIWSPGGIRQDLGGSEGAAKLYALSQGMAKQAGYKGIFFVAMGGHDNDAGVKELVGEGYEGGTTYHWWGDALEKAEDRYHFPYSLVVDTAKAAWERHEAAVADRLQFIPVADTGWASQPWHHDSAMVIQGRTPELFERLLLDAKDFVDARGRKIVALGPCNEWGEGSYIEPCVEYGFGMYDAIRRVFAQPGDWPPDVAPVDVGLGPYDYPQAAEQATWEFNTDGEAEGWGPMMGLGQLRATGGALTAVTSSSDPAFNSPVLRLPASRYQRIVIRMKTDPGRAGDQGQLFWETATAGISEAASAHFDLAADAEYHDYVLEVARSDRWRGMIRGFRFDPCGANGVTVSIDAVRVE